MAAPHNIEFNDDEDDINVKQLEEEVFEIIRLGLSKDNDGALPKQAADDQNSLGDTVPKMPAETMPVSSTEPGDEPAETPEENAEAEEEDDDRHIVEFRLSQSLDELVEVIDKPLLDVLRKVVSHISDKDEQAAVEQTLEDPAPDTTTGPTPVPNVKRGEKLGSAKAPIEIEVSDDEIMTLFMEAVNQKYKKMQMMNCGSGCKNQGVTSGSGHANDKKDTDDQLN